MIPFDQCLYAAVNLVSERARVCDCRFVHHIKAKLKSFIWKIYKINDCNSDCKTNDVCMEVFFFIFIYTVLSVCVDVPNQAHINTHTIWLDNGFVQNKMIAKLCKLCTTFIWDFASVLIAPNRQTNKIAHELWQSTSLHHK